MKNLTFLFLLLISNTLFCQNLQDIIISNNLKMYEVEEYLKTNNISIDMMSCHSIVDADIQISDTVYSKTVKNNFNDNEVFVINLFFQVIYDDNHIRPIVIGEDEMLFVISSLNITYNRFNIFFKYKGFIDINNSDFMTIYKEDTTLDNSHNTLDELKQFSIDEGFYDETALNMFITDEIFRENDNGVELFGIAKRPNTYSVIRDEAFFATTVLHETAHNLNILHVNENSDNVNCEHVTRNDAIDANGNFIDPNYNAHTHGDQVTDTEATFAFIEADLIDENGNIICDYLALFGSETDCQGNPYRVVDNFGNVLINIPFNNYMSPTNNLCRSQFTNGQGVRMRETLANNLNGNFEIVLTDISSLYEPYKIIQGEYTSNYFYQPGFDYDFVLCHQNVAWGGYSEPSVYDDISFIYNNNGYLNYSFDFNHAHFDEIFQRDHTAVRINQLDDLQPRKCYSTFLKTAIGGSVTKFVDDIPSTNVVITQKDSLSINSPTLIQDLQNGLYNIKKNYNDGSTNENLIFKEND